MRVDQFSFGSIRIDGVTYEHDVVIVNGQVRTRKKKLSRPFRDAYGHTPLSIEENIPWDCRRLVIGTGAADALPVMDEVKHEADRRNVELVAVPTTEAIRAIQADPEDTNAILHVTCDLPIEAPVWVPVRTAGSASATRSFGPDTPGRPARR